MGIALGPPPRAPTSIHFPQAGALADGLLEKREKCLGAMKGLVVKAHRHEAPKAIEIPIFVALDAAANIDGLQRHAVFNRCHIATDIGVVGGAEQGVDVMIRQRKGATGAMILKAAPKQRYAIGKQRRGDRIARMRGVTMALKPKLNGSRSVDPFARAGFRASEWHRPPLACRRLG